MGTNYYLMTGNKTKQICNLGCEHEVSERFHVGKSSFGRYFTLQALTLSDGTRLDSLETWKNYFLEKCPFGWFEDEYGDKIELEELVACITREDRQPSPMAKEKFKPEMIGQKVDPNEKPDFFGHYDVWGERGFVHSSGRELGEDGLYVVLEEEFS